MANYKCEICGGKGNKWPVECHEIWEYKITSYDKSNIQKLIGFEALCPSCHKVRHFGFAQMIGKEKEAIEHLMKVNNLTENEVYDYIVKTKIKYDFMSQINYMLDVSYVEEYLNE